MPKKYFLEDNEGFIKNQKWIVVWMVELMREMRRWLKEKKKQVCEKEGCESSHKRREYCV